MSIIQSIILGAIQGLTEFIPVSSSGHMLIASDVLSIPSNFEIETLFNVGTLLAALIYFRKDIIETLRFRKTDSELFKLLVIGTIPLFVFGVVFDLYLQNFLRSSLVTVVMLIGIGLLMIMSKPGERKLDSVSPKDAGAIGLSQVIALIPGTSRSGITMMSGMARGLDAEAAARFSFLLSIPAVGGAIIYTVLDLISKGEPIAAKLNVLVVGNIAAFVTSLIAIHGMISFLKKFGLSMFGWYRIGLGVILLVVTIL